MLLEQDTASFRSSFTSRPIHGPGAQNSHPQVQAGSIQRQSIPGGRTRRRRKYQAPVNQNSPITCRGRTEQINFRWTQVIFIQVA